MRFATTPIEIVEDGTGVEVLLDDVCTGERYRETFDLVVGADGLRLSVRRLVFGPHERFMTTWSAMICAFPLREQIPSFGAQDSLISARAGRAVWVFGLADRAPTALLTYCTKDIDAQFTGDRIERLRARLRRFSGGFTGHHAKIDSHIVSAPTRSGPASGPLDILRPLALNARRCNI